MITPTFTIVTPAADADARRFVATAAIRSFADIPSTVSDDDLNRLIDGVLASCARSCNLAQYRLTPTTLARETVRATWPETLHHTAWHWGQDETLLLPWRAPILSVTVTEGGNALVEDTDFRLADGAMIERIGCAWRSLPIVATYVVGWLPDDDAYPPPDDLVKLIADQVRMTRDQGDMDFNLRSETVEGLGSWQWNVPGGTSIDKGGLMGPLWAALEDYRGPSAIG